MALCVCAPADPASAIVWGLLMQALGYAVAFPLWAIVHLVLSPNDRASLSLRDPARLTAVFPAFLLGYYVPTLLQMAPLPDRAHQTAIALWQPFPIYTGVLAWAFGQMAGRLSPTGGSGMTKAAVDRSAVDTAYNFAVGAGAIAHWATLAIVGAAAVQPELVGGPAVAERLTFVNTFVPYALRTYGTASLAEITFQFLQWDWIFGSAAALVWSTTLAWQVGAWSISVGGIVGIVRDVLLVGPSAAAALIMKRRDAVVYA